MNRVEYQASFWFPVSPSHLWAVIERFDLFESWWGWLADFRADDGGLVNGNVLHGSVIPPVPFRLRLDVRLQRCERPRLVEAAIDGNLRGRATLQLEPAGGGTRRGGLVAAGAQCAAAGHGARRLPLDDLGP
jgi:hypothetical protein